MNRLKFHIGAAALAFTVISSPIIASTPVRGDRAGEVGRTVKDAPPPAWPKSPEAPRDAPNILLIMTDDVGFGASSTFGGPIPTPTFDALASRGLRYTRYHNSAMCSPTRAALLTGRNPHTVGMGATPQRPAGFDGYTSIIPPTAATLPKVMKQAGYSTAMFGKWHLVPEWEMSQTGPFDRWPTGMGFEYFYGFLSADVSQFAPVVTENTTQIEPPRNDKNYHFDADLANRAIGWILQQQQLAPEKPFFVYYATGSAHTPHHAPPEWMAMFRGKFDEGWDAVREQSFHRQKNLGVIPADAVLTPRPEQLPAWNRLSSDERLVSARLMEAYAASLAYADYQIGRVIKSLEKTGELDNTLVIYIQGDNGGSAEGGIKGLAFEQSVINRFDEPFSFLLENIEKIGGPELYTNYPAAWGWAMNSPFPWYKQIASHLGGVRNGMVVAWPDRIPARGLRDQFLYASDVAPTVLEAAGVTAPPIVDGFQQKPIDGISFAYSFNQADAPSRRTRQLFEVFTNLGIYDNGWFAGTSPGRAPWEVSKGSKVALADRQWELYNLAKDYSQSTDLATTNPEKLEQMKSLFWAEAARTGMLPVRDALEGTKGKPIQSDGRSTFRYFPGITRIPESAAPQTIGRSYTIDAEIEVPAAGVQGTLVTQGGRYGGYAFYIADGRLHFTFNAIPPRIYTVRADEKLTSGRQRVSMSFRSDGGPGAGGAVTLLQNGRVVGSGRVEHTLPIWISHTDGFDVGTDTITAIANTYTLEEAPFSGKLHSLEVTLE